MSADGSEGPRATGRPAAFCRCDGPSLVSGQLEDLGGRADELDACLGTRRRQVRVLGEEAVTGVDGVGSGALGGGDDFLDREIRANGVTLLPDLVALVCLETVDRIPILVREHRDGSGT